MRKNLFGGFRPYTEYKDTLKKEAQEKVMVFLEKDYNIIICYDPVRNGMRTVEEALSRGLRFDAILTNVPPSRISAAGLITETQKIERYSQGYKNTLETLRQIRDKANPTEQIPIIAYSSVDPFFISTFVEGGIQAIIFKKMLMIGKQKQKK